MVNQKASQQFYSLALNLYQLANGDSKIGFSSVLDLLHELNNNVEVPMKNVTDQQITNILVAGCKCMFAPDERSAFCKFMFKQCAKQIRLSSLRSSQFEICINYLLDGLEDENDATLELRVDMLRALGALVFENASNTAKFYPRVANLLLSLADRSTKPLEVRRMAINCIGNTCAGAGSKLQPYYNDYYKVLLSNVCVVQQGSHDTIMVASNTLDFSDSAVRKIASSTLRALQLVLSQDKSLVTNPLCDIIQIIHTFIFSSVNTQAYNAIVAVNGKDDPLPSLQQRPAQIRPRVPQAHQQHAVASPTTPPPRRIPISWKQTTTYPRNIGLTSSDSELSDSTADTAMVNPRRQRDDAKIRINALLCLAAVAKTTPRALYPRWQKFVPDTFSIFLSNNTDKQGELYPTLHSDNQPPSLFTILLYDPMPTVRVAVCNTLIAMLDGSKQYLSLASERESKSSFTSLSEHLASILKDMHSGLIYAVKREQNIQVLGLIMKTASVLVANCTYERLSFGYISKLYHAVTSRWSKAPASVRTAILQVVAAIFSTDVEEVKDLASHKLMDEEPLPLIDLVLKSAATAKEQDLIAESWKTLGALAKACFPTVFDAWDSIHPIFKKAFEDSEPSVRASALKFAELFASAMSENDKATVNKNLETNWWTCMLESYIQNTCIDPSSEVRVTTCDCLANLSKRIYEQLPDRYQKLAIALLLPLPNDDDPAIRAAACRALGVFVLFPTLHEDPFFVSDMASAVLEQMNDNAILVRVRASWAQGNLCDALVLESEKEGFCMREWMSMTTWAKILSTATAASLDNDKLRSNAVRAIGSLLRITPKEYFEFGRNMQLVKSAMTGLTKNIETGSLKTRWNACHAASNMLKNPAFPIGIIQGTQTYPWTGSVYTALINSLTRCRNFKVRINACLALATPMNKAKYGTKEQFEDIKRAVSDAWTFCKGEEGGEAGAFQEYRYIEQFRRQVSDALHHIETMDQEE